MIFTHPTNSNAKSSKDLLVLQYGTEKIVMAAPPLYADVIAVAKREFGLREDAKIQLYTKDVTTGDTQTAVRIAESAWLALVPLMATVEVRVVQQTQNAAGVNTPASSAGPSQPVGKVAQKAPMPTPPEAAPARPSTSRTPNQPGKPASKPAEKTATAGGSRTPAQPAPGPSKPAPKPTPKLAQKQSALAEFSDDDEEFKKPTPPVLRSPTKKRVIESEDEDAEEVPGSAKRRRTGGEDAQVKQEKVEPKGVPKVKAEPAVARSEAQRAVTAQASPVRTPKRKPASSQTASTPATGQDQPSGGAVGSDGNFIVTITLVREMEAGEEDDDDTTQFKTKPRHTVRKVLWTACRTFGIQDSYEQIGLFRRNEKGHDVLCEDEEKTIGEYGITSDTYLTIQPLEGEDEA